MVFLQYVVLRLFQIYVLTKMYEQNCHEACCHAPSRSSRPYAATAVAIVVDNGDDASGLGSIIRCSDLMIQQAS